MTSPPSGYGVGPWPRTTHPHASRAHLAALEARVAKLEAQVAELKSAVEDHLADTHPAQLTGGQP